MLGKGPDGPDRARREQAQAGQFRAQDGPDPGGEDGHISPGGRGRGRVETEAVAEVADRLVEEGRVEGVVVKGGGVPAADEGAEDAARDEDEALEEGGSVEDPGDGVIGATRRDLPATDFGLAEQVAGVVAGGDVVEVVGENGAATGVEVGEADRERSDETDADPAAGVAAVGWEAVVAVELVEGGAEGHRIGEGHRRLVGTESAAASHSVSAICAKPPPKGRCP